MTTPRPRLEDPAAPIGSENVRKKTTRPRMRHRRKQNFETGRPSDARRPKKDLYELHETTKKLEIYGLCRPYGLSSKHLGHAIRFKPTQCMHYEM